MLSSITTEKNAPYLQQWQSSEKMSRFLPKVPWTGATGVSQSYTHYFLIYILLLFNHNLHVLVSYQRIEFKSLSYASDELFNTDNTNVFQTEIIIRGINRIGLQPTEICSDDDDIAYFKYLQI
ncbi:unnamed protein product [Rotaria socialis]|uniref:Uncharacterized protein n=1 Tax=Rotaria socialis TaxID=392032 RepID=A0A820S1K4_9BILA|nr:unnamed protein product [Rotaria socialis]CAF4446905.1 unnamed protein product [Rotaria socialis]